MHNRRELLGLQQNYRFHSQKEAASLEETKYVRGFGKQHAYNLKRQHRIKNRKY